MTANQLLKAAKDGKSIVGWHGHTDQIRMPAAFIQNMQFVRVAPNLHRMKIYERKPKRKTTRR